MTRSLVTGAGGFLGRYVAEKLLRRGEYVRGLARSNYPDLERQGIEMVQADIRDADAINTACRDIDVVFHTAAVAGIWGDWDWFHGINTVGTQNIIDACRKNAVSKLVFSSSPSVTFDGSDQINVDESAPYPEQWLCHYPHTKALAEQAVLSADGSKSGDGQLMTCALRPHLIWGPRDQHLIPRLLDRARAGKLRRVGDGTNLIDMVYVENAAEAHLQAADALENGSRVRGQAYFISQGEPVNCWDWIDAILSLAGLPKLEKSISTKAAWNVGRVLESAYSLLRIKSEPRMTRFLAAQLGTSHYFDISKARNDFGYSAQISTADGMRVLANSLGNR